MSIGKLAVLAVALVLVSGGLGAALADWDSPEPGPAIDLVDVDARKADDEGDGALATEEEGDGDDTAGNDGTAGGLNAAPEQPQAQLAGDGDQTAGNDGTAGGDNTEAAPAPVQPVPAGADAGEATDGGGGGAGGGDDDSGDDDTD